MRHHKKFLRSERIRRTTKVLAALSLIISSGCRGPGFNACRSLRCLPWSADSSASKFWDCCDANTPKPPQSVNSAKGSGDATSPASTVPASPDQQSQPVSSISPDNITLAKTVSRYQPESPEALPAVVPVPGDSNQTVDANPTTDANRPRPNPFEVPDSLPGAETPPIKLPPLGSANEDSESLKKRREAIGKLYPPIRPTPEVVEAEPQTEKIGLNELQQIARDNNPRLRVASAAVESARGVMVQAGLPPNPHAGYEADTVFTLNTKGYHGAYIQQTLITARKLGLAAEAAAVDYANASLDLQRTWYEVATDVRRQYFTLLAARRRVHLAEAFLQLSERAYTTQIQIVQSGEAAPYEPLQLRVLVTQARASVIRAQQDAVAAWRVLAASVGVPDLPTSSIRGQIDCPVPVITYEEALTRMLAVHTDIQIAQNTVGRNRTLLTLANRQPIPNIDVGVVVQHDFTFVPGTTTYNLMVGGAIPVFDRNQGNRVSARADLVQASQNISSVQNGLIARLAPVYSSYEANRQLASTFRTDALQDQVRAYRGVYQRYFNAFEEISFNDVIVAQQTLSATLNQYLDILQNQWGSVVDLAGLLQMNDVFELGPVDNVAEIPLIDTDVTKP